MSNKAINFICTLVRNVFISVQYQAPLAGRLLQSKIAGSREVVGPLVFEDLSMEFGSYLFGSISGAGVDNYNFVNELKGTVQTTS
ncbi:hypothetical protein D3C87_1711000 [compost metagenome]